MAALTIDQFNLEYTDGKNLRTALFSLKNVDAADTIDVGGYFKVVKRAGLISTTNTHVLSMTLTSATVLTVPAGPVDDGLWLLVVGVSA